MLIYGSSDVIHDEGKTLPPPQTYNFGKPRRFVIVFPTIFRQRFLSNPKAFEAVLSHELAHLQNKDFELLEAIKKLLFYIIVVLCFSFVVELYFSISADTNGKFNDLKAIQASLVGKNYIFAEISLIASLFFYKKSIENWREALADYVATNISKDSALESAEKIIIGSSKKLDRPSAKKRKQALTLTWREIILLGFSTIVISEYAIAGLVYIANILLPSTATTYLSAINPALADFISYICFFYILRILANSTETYKLLARDANLLLIGGIIGHTLTQTLPLLITSIAMPDGYDKAYFHDPEKLFFGSLITESLSISFVVLFSVIGVLISRANIVAGIVLGVIWMILTFLESTFFPEILEGWLSIIVALVFISLFLLPKFKINILLQPSLFSWFPIIALIFLFWLGYGDVNHLAACSTQAAVYMEKNGKMIEALAVYQRAANHAPMVADGWMQLSASFIRNNNIDQAITASERAIATPFTSNWETIFQSQILAGDLRLQRRKNDDVNQALKHYEIAQNLWYHSSRLPRNIGINLLINEACALSLIKADKSQIISRLIEALVINNSGKEIINPELSENIKTDNDLENLQILNQTQLSQITISTFLINSKDATAPVIRDTAKQYAISDDELLKFLSYLVYQLK